MANPSPPQPQPPPAAPSLPPTPVRRRYPKLLTFHNGYPIPHPLPKAPLHYPPLPIKKPPPRQKPKKAKLPPLKPQPAISEENTRWTIQEDERLRNSLKQRGKEWVDVAEDLPGRSADEVARRALIVSGKRLARWGRKEDDILIEAFRKFGNDWTTIASMLPGRSPLAVRKHFHSKIRDRCGFTANDVRHFHER